VVADPFQETADPACKRVGQLREFLSGGRLYPAKPECAVGLIHIHAIQEQQ